MASRSPVRGKRVLLHHSRDHHLLPSRPVCQVALSHSLAVVVCCCGLCFRAGFWLGTVLQQWVQPAQASMAKDTQRAASQEAW